MNRRQSLRSWFKEHRGILLRCLVAFTLAVFVTGFAVYLRGRIAREAGYRFSTSDTDSGGPRIGDRINVREFRSSAGKALIDEIKNHPFTMVVLVDPQCGACAASKDQIWEIREAIDNSPIYYCVLMLTKDEQSAAYQEFADALGLKDRFFVSSPEKKPNDVLATMVIPSHLLIDSTGSVVRKWPGTNRNSEVRMKMANQIIADALAQLR